MLIVYVALPAFFIIEHFCPSKCLQFQQQVYSLTPTSRKKSGPVLSEGEGIEPLTRKRFSVMVEF